MLPTRTSSKDPCWNDAILAYEALLSVYDEVPSSAPEWEHVAYRVYAAERLIAAYRERRRADAARG